MRLRRESPANNTVSLRFTGLLLDCESNPRFECGVFTALEAGGKGEAKLGLTTSGKESDIVILVILELDVITFFKFEILSNTICLTVSSSLLVASVDLSHRPRQFEFQHSQDRVASAMILAWTSQYLHECEQGIYVLN